MSNDDIKAMTVRELRELCKGNPLYAGYSKCKRKAELVGHIIKCLECEVLVAEFECRDCVEEDITIEEIDEANERYAAILAKPEELTDSEKKAIDRRIDEWEPSTEILEAVQEYSKESRPSLPCSAIPEKAIAIGQDRQNAETEHANPQQAIAQLAPNPLVEFFFMACRVVYAFCAVSWGIAYQAGKLTYKAGYAAGSVTRKVRNGFALAGMIAKRSPLLQLNWAY